MLENLTYNYTNGSALRKENDQNALFLAKYSEIEKPDEAPCFFWGQLTQPYLTAKCLLTLSNVVKSSFSLSPADLANLKDPIITTGNERMRFEGFSFCAGVYARVDVLPSGLDGEFIQNGTTNVDFNQPMLTALSKIGKNDRLVLSVGQKEFALHQSDEKLTERKVPLPTKWIKGLTTVQQYLSQSDLLHEFSKLQLVQLFQSIPKTVVKKDYYLTVRGNKPMFTPVSTKGALCLGGLHRLRLLENLLPLASKLLVYAHPEMQATTWQFHFGDISFSLVLSRDPWRGFSGEGALLEDLLDEVPTDLLKAFDRYSYANQSFQQVLTTLDESLPLANIESLSAQLAAMGLLGFDLETNSYFYRRLPYKTERILNLNPRLKGAEKLIKDGKVVLISTTAQRTEARVEGTGVSHTIIVSTEADKCTCQWFSNNQGQRGPCKHILAVKKMIR